MTQTASLLTTALAYFAAGRAAAPDDPTAKYPVDLKGWETVDIIDVPIRAWWARGLNIGIGVRDVEGLGFDNKGHPSAADLYSE